MKELDYNYRSVKLQDMRFRGSKERGYYILKFNQEVPPVNIDSNVFESVLFRIYRPRFIDKLERKDLFNVKWNLRIDEGFYWNWDSDSKTYQQISGYPERHYCSRIDQDGPLTDYTYNN